MKEYIVVDREMVTIVMDDKAKTHVIRREIMTVIEVLLNDFGVNSWGAYRGMVMLESITYSEIIESIVMHGHPLQKYEAIIAIQDKPLGWNLENCRYDNGLFS